MSFLKEVVKRKPIAESITGVKLFRIDEDRKKKLNFLEYLKLDAEGLIEKDK